MTVADVEVIMEEWAPRWTAWERDNVGLQVGDPRQAVRKILVTLDVTPEVVTEARNGNVDLIIAHHPLLFRPPKSVTSSDPVGSLVLQLVKQGTALYASHTNLDFTRDGVSFALARTLGLNACRFLVPLERTLAKIAVFVPRDDADRVLDAMAMAGAGRIGNYSSCSFRVAGTGTFRGSDEANPAVGRKGVLESVEEVRLEMIVPRARIRPVVDAMKRAHPYEEVAYDVYDLENPDPNYGMGAMGELEKAISVRAFVGRVKSALGAERIRLCGNPDRSVRRVAVCGGSGSDLLEEAIRQKADAFLTADVRYHTFHEANGRIALLDAGHWETEQVILQSMTERLRQAAKARGERIVVRMTRHKTNPIHFQ